jgi:hypothetical protein
MVEGTPGPDRIQILPTQLPGTVRVVFDGKVLGSYGPVAKIDVNAGAGNDTVTVDPRITLPTILDGGPGNDRLQGGSGPNVLLGGGGNDTLIGNPNRDTLEGGPGQNSLVIQKSLGVVQVGPSASGAGLKRLSGAYRLMPLQVAGPAVVGAADLRNGRIAGLLRNDYAGGQTVAIANATANDADALASLLGYPAPVAFSAGVLRADLVAFRKINQGGRTLFSTSILLPVVNVRATPAQRLAGSRANALSDRAYLAGVFTPTPSIPAPPQIADPQNDLLQLAAPYEQTKLYTSSDGFAAQLVDTVWDARSFTNQVDLYYVKQEIDVDHGAINDISNILSEAQIEAPLSFSGGPPSIIQPSPLANPGTTTITTGVNKMVGGSVGWSGAQGLNVSISGGATYIDQTSTTTPPIAIAYEPLFNASNPAWNFAPTNGPIPEATLYDSWIWQVPFKDYLPDQTTFNFVSSATATVGGDSVTPAVDLSVPLPFGDTFQLGSPKVTSVSTPTVKPGDSFTIEGTALYPSTVQAVLIGGQPLSTANFTPVSDTQIQVVAPNTPGSSLPVVIKTSLGLSNTDVTINITGTPQVHVQAQPVAAVAGQAFTNQTVASFTDSDPSAQPGDFTANIDWGDGNTSNGTITAAGPGTFDVTGSHTYATAGSYTIGIQVTACGGSPATATGTATVSSAGPQHLVAQPVAAVAGQAFTNQTVATFTDSDPNANPADLAATINWGDGNTSGGTITAAGPGTFDVTGSHTYATAGTYTFGVQVTDSGGNKATATGTATVSSSAGGPQNLVTNPFSALVNQAFTNLTVATFTDSDPNANPADFTANISWGDGIQNLTTVTAAGPGTFDVLGTHTYLAAGNYTFGVQVTDSSGTKVTATGTAMVT